MSETSVVRTINTRKTPSSRASEIRGTRNTEQSQPYVERPLWRVGAGDDTMKSRFRGEAGVSLRMNCRSRGEGWSDGFGER